MIKLPHFMSGLTEFEKKLQHCEKFMSPSGVATLYACMLKHTHNFHQKKNHGAQQNQ